jgi:hypothetical protein
MVPTDRSLVSSWKLVLIALLLGILVAMVYLPSVHSLPAADDFLLPTIVRTGSVQSLWEFFWRSPMDDYRPLQWIVAAWSIRTAPDVFAALHVLTFVAFIPYVIVLLLWIRRLRYSAVAAACAIAVVFLHPIMAGPLGELDTFSRFLTSAPMWLGVLAADRYAERLPLAVASAALCLAVALGFTEYAVGMVAMAPVAVYFRRSEYRIRGAVLMWLALMMVVAIYLVMRHIAVDATPNSSISLNPAEWVRNIIIMTVALLYPGNSIGIVLGTGPGRFFLLAVGCGLFAAWLGIGLWLSRARTRAPDDASIPYLLALLAASYAPMFVRTHVSEIYLTAPVFAIGLLAGRAAEGWDLRVRVRGLGFAALAALLVWGLLSAASKQRAIAARGARADRLIRQLQAQVPAAVRDTTVWLVFPERGPRYSTFVMGDDFLIQPEGPAQRAAEWFWPGRNIRLRHAIGVRSVPPDAGSSFVLCWSAATAVFEQSRDGTCPPSLLPPGS